MLLYQCKRKNIRKLSWAENIIKWKKNYMKQHNFEGQKKFWPVDYLLIARNNSCQLQLYSSKFSNDLCPFFWQEKILSSGFLDKIKIC